MASSQHSPSDFTIEWTGRRHASDADESRGIAAATDALNAGAPWEAANTACSAAMFRGWDSEPDNWYMTTHALMNAAPLMDDDIRESIHDDARADDPLWFLGEYQRQHRAKFGEDFSAA